MLAWSSVYLWSNAANAYTDLEFGFADIPGASSTLMAATADRLYLGLDRTFDGIYFDLAVPGAGYSSTLTWEYWNGAAWRSLPISVNYIFNGDGVVRFVAPTDWVVRLLNGVQAADTGLQTDDLSSGVAKYWVRVATTAVPTVVATLTRSLPFPTYLYTTPAVVNAFLQLRQAAFSATTAPTISQVEDMIRRIEGRIEGYTTLSWKPKYREDELYEFARFGFTLKRYPLISMLELAIWNGGDFEVMVEGRGQDYFVDNLTGIVTFSRLLNLPFAYTRTRSWGFGEFRRAIRVKYVWGRDIDVEERGGMVRDIATKFVAADILSNYDYTTLIPQGSDRFSLEGKIEYWRSEAENRLEELRPMRSYIL